MASRPRLPIDEFPAFGHSAASIYPYFSIDFATGFTGTTPELSVMLPSNPAHAATILRFVLIAAISIDSMTAYRPRSDSANAGVAVGLRVPPNLTHPRSMGQSDRKPITHDATSVITAGNPLIKSVAYARIGMAIHSVGPIILARRPFRIGT
jgi:hypothetical protein